MVREDLEDLIKSLGGEILNVGKTVKTVAQAAEATGSSPRKIIKSLLLIAGGDKPILAIVDGESRVDFRKMSRHFGAVRLATPREVKELTGYEVGELPPVGIRVRTVIDPRVLENEFVIGGGGRVDRLSKLSPRRIVEYQRAEVLDISSR